MGLVTQLIDAELRKKRDERLTKIEGWKALLSNPTTTAEMKEKAVEGLLKDAPKESHGIINLFKPLLMRGGKKQQQAGQNDPSIPSYQRTAGGQVTPTGNPENPISIAQSEYGEAHKKGAMFMTQDEVMDFRKREADAQLQQATQAEVVKQSIIRQSRELEFQQKIKQAVALQKQADSGQLDHTVAQAAIGSLFGSSVSAPKPELKDFIAPNGQRVPVWVIPPSSAGQDATYRRADTGQPTTLPSGWNIGPVKEEPNPDKELSQEVRDLIAGYESRGISHEEARKKALERRGKELDTRQQVVVQNLVEHGEAREAAPAIAASIKSGKFSPDDMNLLRFNRPLAAKVDSILAKDGFDFETWRKDWIATSAKLRTMNGQQMSRIGQAINTLGETIPNIAPAFDRWKRTGLPSGFRVYNKAALKVAMNLPGEAGAAARDLNIIINDITPELSYIYMGGNAPTDHALEIAARNLAGDWNEEQFKAAIDRLNINYKIRKSTFDNAQTWGIAGNENPNPLGKEIGTPEDPLGILK